MVVAGLIVRNDEVVGSIPTSSTNFSMSCRSQHVLPYAFIAHGTVHYKVSTPPVENVSGD